MDTVIGGLGVRVIRVVKGGNCASMVTLRFTLRVILKMQQV